MNETTGFVFTPCAQSKPPLTALRNIAIKFAAIWQADRRGCLGHLKRADRTEPRTTRQYRGASAVVSFVRVNFFSQPW